MFCRSLFVLQFKASHLPFGIFWPLYCLSFIDLRLLISPLVSFGHCIVCLSLIYSFWFPIDLRFGIFWSLYCLSFIDLRLLIFPLVSFGHCIVCLSLIYASDFPFGIFWPLYCLSFIDLRISPLISLLVSFGHCIVCLSLIYGFWFPFFGIFWSLYCLSFIDLRLLISPLVSFGHCIVCLSLIYGFWFSLWYLLVIVLSVFHWFTASDFPFGIFWSLYCLYFIDLRLLISPLVSFGHCIVCLSLIYASDFPFGIFWPLYCLSFIDLQLLISPLVSFGHCIVCLSLIYSFWFPLWYLLVIVLSVFHWFTASDFHFGIFWPLYCLSFIDLRLLISPFGIFWPLYCLSFIDLQLLISPLVSFGHCIVCHWFTFWFPFWYLLAIVLSVFHWFTASDFPFGIFWSLYCLSFIDLRLLISPLVSFGHCIVCLSLIYASDFPFGIFWPLYCLSFIDLRLLISPLVSFGHCIVCLSLIYGFWFPLWYLLVIVLSVFHWFTASDFPFGIFWSLYCLSFIDLRLLISLLVSFGHCIVCLSLIYGFWFPLWYLLAIVLSVFHWFTASDFPFGIFWSLYCLSFIDLRLLISLWYLLVIVLSVFHWFTASDFPFGIFWSLYCLSFIDLQLLISPLVSFGHCIVCLSLIYGFWFPFWYLLAIVLSVFHWFTASDFPFGIFWPLYCLSFIDLRLLISLLVSFGHCIAFFIGLWFPFWYLLAIVLLSFIDLRLLISPLVSFGHCIVCLSLIYGFWFPFWYLLVIVLSVFHWFTASDFPFGIFWPLYCLSFIDLQLLISPLVSFGHCIVCLSLIYGFWFPLWYLLAIVLTVFHWFTASDFPFGIFWSLYCLSFIDLRPLISLLVSFGHCIVCLSLITASDFPFGIFWSLYCLSFIDLRLLISPLVSFGHCIVCLSLIYGFWFPLWYLLAIVLSVFHWFTASDFPFGIFWSLYCLSFIDLRLLISPLVSFGHCIVCLSLIYSFWFPLWYLLAIVLSVFHWFTASDFPFGIFWSLYWLSFIDYGFWFPLWYLLAIVLTVFHWFSDSFPFGIFWSCLSLIYGLWFPFWYLLVIVLSVFHWLRLLISPLVSFGHCIDCLSLIYGFWFPLWYLLVFVLSVFHWFTASDFPFGIFWPLYWLSFIDLRLLISPLVSFGHCIVCLSLIYSFWFPLWYLLVIVLSVFHWFTASDFPFGIFWSLYCLYFIDYGFWFPFGIFWSLYCLSFIDYGFWFPRWYLLAIVLSVFHWFTASDFPFGIFWPLYCLSFIDLQLLISPLVSFGHCCLYSDFPGIFWPLYCLYFIDLRLLISPLVSFGHCIVCLSLIYGFWFPLWYLLVIVLSVFHWFTAYGFWFPLWYLLAIGHWLTASDCLLYCLFSLIYGFWFPLWYLLAIVLSVFHWFTASDFPFGIFWSLYCLYFIDLRLLIFPLVSFGHCIVCLSLIYSFWFPLWYLLAIVLSVFHWFTASDFPFGIFWSLYCLSFIDLLLISPLVSFGHCIVCISLIYSFWFPFWYLLAIVLSVFHWFTASDFPFGIFWSLYCLSFIDLRLLISPLVSFGHCIVCISLIYGFWFPLWYLLVIVLSVFHWFTASDFPFGIFWPLYCLYFIDLRLLISLLVSFGHCIVCLSLINGFWFPFWYLLVIVLSVFHWFTASDFPFGIFWPLYCLSFIDLQLLISPLVSFGHCIVCLSLIYSFWFPLWYLLVIVLSVFHWFTASDFPFGIFWSLYCLSFIDLRLLISPLVSFGHCIVCLSLIYGFWFPLWYLLVIVLYFCLSLIYSFWFPFWYLLAIVLSVFHWFTASDFPFGIFWSLYCLSFIDLRLLISPLVSFGHCIVCLSLIYGFWFPLWYLLAIVLSVFHWFTASDFPFGIFWSLYCLSFIDLQLLISPLVSFGHCIVCLSLIYSFWFPLWYLLVIVLSVFHWFTASDFPFGIFWSLYCLSFIDLRLLISPLVSFGHCIVCLSLIYSFWFPLWYLLVIVLSVFHWFTASDFPFGICWSLHCLSFIDLQLLISPLVSFGHCIDCLSLIYSFWFPLWYLLVIVLSVFHWFTASDFPFGIFWSLYCLSFIDYGFWFPFGIFWSLYCLSFID